MEPDAWRLLKQQDVDELLDFIEANAPLFHIDTNSQEYLNYCFDNLFENSVPGDDIKASNAPSYYPARPPKKLKDWPMVNPASWATYEENAFITVSKEQIEKLYNNPPFYNSTVFVPLASTPKDLLYKDYVEKMEEAKNTTFVGHLQDMLQKIAGLHGPYADPLRSFIKARIEYLNSEKANPPFVGYEHKKVEKLVLPKLKKLKMPGTEKPLPPKSEPPVGALLFDPPYGVTNANGDKFTYEKMGDAMEKLKKIAMETSVPIMVAHKPAMSHSTWALDMETFADFEMKQEMQKEVSKMYAEYMKKYFYPKMTLSSNPPNPVAPSYPKYESEYMAKPWEDDHIDHSGNH